METLLASITVCLIALVALCLVLRKAQLSLGLPIAYLGLLLLNHVPGAFAHAFGSEFILEAALTETSFTETGIMFTAIGAVSFFIGVALSQKQRIRITQPTFNNHRSFLVFCLYGGWIATFLLAPLAVFPSIGAAVDKGGAIWILGALLGLRSAMLRGSLPQTLFWVGAIAVYPMFMLLFGGFLSYGTAAAMIAISALAINVKSFLRVLASIALIVVLGISFFANYFVARNQIREVAWSNAGFVERVDATWNAFSFELFAMSNPKHLNALDQRLNQNYFVGIAASRLDAGFVDHKHGWSLVEAAMSMVPRAMWPDKPVYGGSPAIVREMTGLDLSETTSWGVGNVMEFHINFDMYGLIFGFLALGWLLGLLDRNAALAELRGDFGGMILCFLPAVALIQPLGSLVELASGSAAALVAAYLWRAIWINWSSRGRHLSEPREFGAPAR